MATQTTYYHLTKPGYSDNADISTINSNMDTIDSTLHAIAASDDGKKPKQSAVSDPTASGTGVTFIDTLSQNANGVITPTKKTVRTMSGATSSAAGATGLVPQPAAGSQGKFLRGDGSWQTPSNTWRGFQVIAYTKAYTLAAGANISLSANDFGMSTPSGYSPVAVLRASSGGSRTCVVGFSGTSTGDNTAMKIYNPGSSSESNTAKLTILYLQNS